MTSHVILGKGQIGTTLARLLAEKGEPVTVLSRSGGTDAPGITHRRVDVADATALAEAADGARVIYNCVNPGGYEQWTRLWPPMFNAILDATERVGADLVITGNLYVYGPVSEPMTEETPLAARGSLGRLRIDMWRQALERHRAGRIRVTEARGSDYFGPLALTDAVMGSMAMGPVMSGKTVRLPGDLDAPHSWTYIPDVAATLALLGSDDRSWGRAWHVPTAEALSAREMVSMMAGAAGTAPARISPLPWWMVTKVAGLFQPRLRYMTQLRYQFDRPFRLDSSLVTREFGLEPTDTATAVAETVEWWRAGAKR